MGETITFWVLAVVSVGAAFGLVFSRKAVYSALMLGVVMLSLAVLYAVQDAPSSPRCRSSSTPARS